MPEPDFISVFVGPLEKLGIDYIVTGSIAAIFYGEPRLTHDIDIVLHLRVADIERFCAAFPDARYYCPPPEILRIELSRDAHAHFNLIHHETGLKADIYPFTGDALHRWALDNYRAVEIEGGVSIKLAPPEYVIIRKLQFYRTGGSQKHLQDVRSILKASADIIDEKFLAAEVAKGDLEGVLKKARGD